MLLKRVQPRNTRYRQCYSRSHASPPRWYLHLCDSSTSTTIWARGLIVKRSVGGRGLQHMGGSVAGFPLDKTWYSVLCACVAVCRVHTGCGSSAPVSRSVGNSQKVGRAYDSCSTRSSSTTCTWIIDLQLHHCFRHWDCAASVLPAHLLISRRLLHPKGTANS